MQTSRTLIDQISKDGAQAYREAVAAAVEDRDASDLWERWEQDTAALLLVSWASGAIQTLRDAGAPLQGIAPRSLSRFAREDDIAVRFRSEAAREVVRRFVRLMPMTRERWETLVQRAQEAARQLRESEQATALDEIANRSPDLAALIRGKPEPQPEGTPEEVRTRRTPAVQGVVQGTFFVTGMDERQVRQTKRLLARVIRGEASVSTAGKAIERIGIGDFVSKATLQTGTDLTAARLETVYRTNANRAATQGRLDIVRDETVRKFVPLMQFSATKDKRTRPSHTAMHGYVATVEDIDRQAIPTPLGFNCRCTWKPIPLAVAYGKGWCNEEGTPNREAIQRHNGARQKLIDSGEVPDRGFLAG